MYSIYQNKYANKLHLNIIRVRYAEDRMLIDKDFAIRLNANYKYDEVNDLITFKLYLFLGCLITQNGLKDEMLTLDTKTLLNAFKIGKKRHIISSLEYLKAIEFKYIYYKGKDKANKWLVEERGCKIIEDYSSSKGIIQIRFNKGYLQLLGNNHLTIKLPPKLFELDIKNYHHSLFMGFRILLHQQVSFNKTFKNTLSVKEIVKYCSLLPTYDESKKQKQTTRATITPFENNLNYVSKELGFKWQYAVAITTYNSFINNKIIFESNNWGCECNFRGLECKV